MDLITLVAHIHAAATERGDEPIITICEQLGHRLIAEAEQQAKEVMTDTVPEVSSEHGDVPGEPLTNSEETVKEVMPSHSPEHNERPQADVPATPAAECPACAKRLEAARLAQKRWRKRHKGNSKPKEAVVHGR